MLDGTSLDPRTLRNAFGTFATGVTVVTLLDDSGNPTGVTVNSFSSLSLKPALCLFSLGKEQASCRWIDTGCQFIVNVLAEGQDDIAWGFAKPREDKFDGVPSAPGSVVDVPYIKGALSRFECRLWANNDGGDHDLIIGEVLHVDTDEGRPMLFYRGALDKLA
jgi:flavin reductase (DIM6/NTAB) family NADH-FMN oxidoreductase RutF